MLIAAYEAAWRTAEFLAEMHFSSLTSNLLELIFCKVVKQ